MQHKVDAWAPCSSRLAQLSSAFEGGHWALGEVKVLCRAMAGGRLAALFLVGSSANEGWVQP